ncbi:MAG: hypothetical protein ACF8GE_05490 [Phycisphaerales bacterium JB043]
MPDPQDQIDFSWQPEHTPSSTSGLAQRPWLSVYFQCCHVYTRIYRSADGTAYSGACPRCGNRVRARVGPGGTTQRFFRAS